MRNEQKDLVKKQFGASADAYANSEVHARGESLSLLVDLIEPQKGWRALDVATGAGHTAMAIAPLVAQIIATDITGEMLLKTSELAKARGIKNLSVEVADAESLPFDNASFDLVTCRIALHHFGDPKAAIGEFSRVLKPGGVLGFVDNTVVDDIQAADYYNAFEKIRDPSHHRVFSLPELRSMMKDAGLHVETACQLTKEVEFQDWADRQHVSDSDKKRLIEMIKDLPSSLRTMLAPRYADNTVYFSLREAVVVAKKV